MTRSLMCFAHGRPGDWEGICVDLDLAVQGASFEEVKRGLAQAIAMYFEAAAQEDEATRTALLNRHAPWFVRARLALRFLFNATRHRNDGDDLSAGFSMPCPA